MKKRLIPALLFTLIVGGGGWVFWREVAPKAHQEETADSGPAVDEVRTKVTLSPEKVAATKIATTSVEMRMLQDIRQVPGRLIYDDTRHIEVKVPTVGTLADVRVKPGDVVESGAVLAILSSPEVGNARADVLKRRAELSLAERQWTWKESICRGLKQLVNAVEEGRDAAAIVADMDSTSLGAYREQVMTAYSRFRLARQLLSNINALSDSGAVPLSTVQQRTSELNAAEAALKAITEQSLFEAQRECNEARVTVDDAQRRVRISEQHLRTLLGYQEDVQADDDMQQLSYVELRAPFAGTIEAKNFSSKERVTLGDSVCVLADTSLLWVAADIREREWGALRLQPGQAISVTTPGLPGVELQAQVYYVGRQVDPATNAVPLIATIANTEGLLRPGQFVRVALPVAAPVESIAVPDSALLEHEEATFVFVPGVDGEFQQVHVTPGLSSEGWTAVTGIEVGTPVVSHGAFALKSELLLEGEE